MENKNETAVLIPNIEIVTLNVNDLLKAIKRQEIGRVINICWLYKTHFKYNGTGRLKVKGWKTFVTYTLISK